MSSYTSSPRHLNEYDFDNEDNGPDSASEIDDDREFDGNHNVSDEDTEDASETEEKTQTGNRTEIKEQMYQDKLSQLKKQLQMLQDGTLSDFVKRSKKIHQQYQERQRQNEAWRDLELDIAVLECEKEKKDADREYDVPWMAHGANILGTDEVRSGTKSRGLKPDKRNGLFIRDEKKIELKELLVSEWQEKKLNIETERQSMDLANGGNAHHQLYMFDVKPIMTRKLRRRPNDPLPLPAEKRRKTSPATIIQLLNEKDISDDLEVIQKTRPLSKKPQPSSALPMMETSVDVRIEYGKLLYDKRWFHRGTHVIVESKEAGKVFGQIYGIGHQEIWIRRSNDNSKLRLYITQLQKGKYTLQRRTS